MPVPLRRWWSRLERFLRPSTEPATSSARPPRQRGWRRLPLGTWLIALTTLALAIAATRAILQQTGGEVCVPLDDAFIHFQFAHTIAAGRPFQYSAGFEPVAGATSLLWAAALAPFEFVGLNGMGIIWVAWALGWSSLGLLAFDTWRAAQGLVSDDTAAAAAAMVLAFGGFAWFASSGMEVVPLAWVLVRTARRVAEWAEGTGPVTKLRIELCVLGALAPAVRPEGAIASLLVLVALIGWPRGGSRSWGLVPLLGLVLPGAINWLFTGDWSTTTVQAKWLLASPYRHRIPGTIRYHLGLLLNTLLDGRVWSSVFLPRGAKWVAWCALPALVGAGWMRERRVRALALLAVGLGIFIPVTYDTFLVNRLRYLWPFAPAWFVGLAALADGVGAALACWRRRWVRGRMLAAGIVVGALAAQMPGALTDLAQSTDAIRRQQVALGRWVHETLPADAIVGVNDAGAIAYLGKRRTFDLVGLTTRGEALPWLAGPGSRFEHYEHLDPARRPTHLVVYENWLAVPPLLGEYLTSRTVTGATILGGATKSAYLARWDALGTAEQPLELHFAHGPTDVLDVADLQSEQAHDYQLFWATQQDDVVVEDPRGRVDGGRSQRSLEQFQIAANPGGYFVARLAAPTPTTVRLELAGRFVADLELQGDRVWEEVQVTLPHDLPEGRQPVRLTTSGSASFTALHYWTFPPG